MDERTDGISRRQLSILLFVSALSPLIRQAPGMMKVFPLILVPSSVK